METLAPIYVYNELQISNISPYSATDPTTHANVPGIINCDQFLTRTSYSQAGLQTLTGIFVPDDYTSNYISVATATTIQVYIEPYTVSWGPLSDILYGTAIGSAQENENVVVSNSGNYVIAGHLHCDQDTFILSVGTHMLTASYIPNDSTSWGVESATAQITVVSMFTTTTTTTTTIAPTVVNTISVQEPFSVTTNSTGTLLYVSSVINSNPTYVPTSSQVNVYNIPSYTLNTVISGSSFRFANIFGLAINPAGTLLYAADSWWTSGAGISVVNIPSNTFNSFIPNTTLGIGGVTLEDLPNYVAINPAGTLLYTVTTQKLIIINIPNNTFNTSIVLSGTSTGGGNGIIISPDGTKLYLTSSNAVYVYNIPNYTLNSVINLPNYVHPTVTTSCKAQGLTISPDGTKLYVTDGNTIYYPGRIIVVDIPSNTIDSIISLPDVLLADGGQYQLALDPTGTYLYATNYSSNKFPASNVLVIKIK